MDIRAFDELKGRDRELWLQLLARVALSPDEDADRTVLIYDEEGLAAAGSRKKDLLKCIAVDPSRQGEGLTAAVLTALRQDALQAGARHLFLYTKPQNELRFSSLFFYPVARTRQAMLMESVPGGIRRFLEGLPICHGSGPVGAAVMNCSPFTRGHLHLIATAASRCAHLYVFVLSEEQPPFSSADRMAMVKAGTAHLPNVTVLPTGPYLISNATFPTYFLRERDQAQQVHCELDIDIFTRYFVPRFSISRRFVGEEPLSPMTARYNEILARDLPKAGVALEAIPRLEDAGGPISASAVRACIASGQTDRLRELVPPTTFDYLQANGLL